jgi:predicted transcriptional regulator of viral defense system
MSTERQVVFDTDTYLARNPVFTLSQVSEAMGRGRARAQSWAKYHLGTGRLRGVERSTYAVVPPGTDPDSFLPDRFLVAAALRPDGIFAYHSALELLGAAHSAWHVAVVLSDRRRRAVELGSDRIEFHEHPAKLRFAGSPLLGTLRLPYRMVTVTTAGPERTLVEGFRLPRLVGGLEELVESAGGFPALDFEALMLVLRAFDQKALYAAIGWFLERYQRVFYVPDELLLELERERPVSPYYLPRRLRGQGGVHLRRWNLVLAETVVQLAEPDEA